MDKKSERQVENVKKKGIEIQMEEKLWEKSDPLFHKSFFPFAYKFYT